MALCAIPNPFCDRHQRKVLHQSGLCLPFVFQELQHVDPGNDAERGTCTANKPASGESFRKRGWAKLFMSLEYANCLLSCDPLTLAARFTYACDCDVTYDICLDPLPMRPVPFAFSLDAPEHFCLELWGDLLLLYVQLKSFDSECDVGGAIAFRADIWHVCHARCLF